MPEIPLDFGQSVTRFEIIGTTTFGAVVLGHSFGLTVPSATDGANAVMDSWEGGQISSIITDEWRVTQVDMSIMTATGLETASSTRVPIVGLLGDAGNTANTAALIRKATARAGREGRGRMYVPGVAEPFIDPSGNFNAAYIADIQAFATDFHGTLALNDVPMVLLHNDPAVSPDLVLALSAQTRAATQRKRMRR